jgi:hypothetical protein
MIEPTGVARTILGKYKSAYGSNLQGCCPLIADEIIRSLGGVAVAGYLTWYGGSCRRQHWWAEVDGETVDPMGDEFLAGEVATGREESHRDQDEFRKILPKFERWRFHG